MLRYNSTVNVCIVVLLYQYCTMISATFVYRTFEYYLIDTHRYLYDVLLGCNTAPDRNQMIVILGSIFFEHQRSV